MIKKYIKFMLDHIVDYDNYDPKEANTLLIKHNNSYTMELAADLDKYEEKLKKKSKHRLDNEKAWENYLQKKYGYT